MISALIIKTWDYRHSKGGPAACIFVRNHFIRNLRVEFRNIYSTYTTKEKFSMEFFNLNNLYNTKQSRSRKMVLFMYSQSLSPSFLIDLTFQPKIKDKIQTFNVLLVSVPLLCTICALKIKEPLRNF